jgi:hypothetical protein
LGYVPRMGKKIALGVLALIALAAALTSRPKP